ncbi:MAG TPA: 3-isopropylmalate dehydratase small subunit [Terriglobia bacterium]|nr:3-isopropylmalate dehydratase small subunit [Terriglobia bacterium]
MQPFVKHTGLVAPMDRVNVDTDQMVPKQFLKALTREGFGRTLFYDWRYLPGEVPNPDFILNAPRYKGASVLLARANFGCGSSREHAPWAILDYGFHAIIAPSYADIFYNNCFKNGILPVTLPDAQVDDLFQRTEKTPGYELTVDLETDLVTDAHGLKQAFEIDPFRRECLLNGWDDIGLTLRHQSLIDEFEKAHPQRAVAFEPVDAIVSKSGA